jgi:hypothetical protein
MTRMILTLIVAASTSLTLARNQDKGAQPSDPKHDSVTALLEILSNQPDYTADVNMVIAEPQRMKMSRKQGKLRREFLYPVKDASGKDKANAYYRTITIERLGQSTILFEPQQKTYCEIPVGSSPPVIGMQQLLDNLMNNIEGIRVRNLGTEILDEHEATKMHITMTGDKPPKSDRHGLFFYFAKDLKNLLIKFEVLELYEDKPTPPGKGWSYTLSNISLDVSDDLFQMPVGYKKVDLNSFLATLKQHIPK